MKRYSDVVLDRNGNVVVGATVTITDYASGTSSTVYGTDAIGANVNPLTTDSAGGFTFYAKSGKYTLTITKTGITTTTATVIIDNETWTPEEFGAVGNYVPSTGAGTDDSTAINAALTAASAAGGGVVKLDPCKRYKVSTFITIPINVSLECDGVPQGGFSNLGNTAFTSPAIAPTLSFRSMGGALWICFDAGKGDGTGTYNVTDVVGLTNYASRTGAIALNGKIRGVKIFQYSFDNAKAASYTDNATWNSAWDSGVMASLAIRQSSDDAVVEDCLIGGFMQGILSYSNARGRFENNLFDCMNGIEVALSTDIHYLKNNVQALLATAGYSLGSLVRRGTFVYLHDQVDWGRVVDCFTYGSKVGCYLANVNFPTVHNFGADNNGIELSGYYGVRIASTTNYAMLSNINVANREFGIKLDGGASTFSRINGANLVTCTTGILVSTGDAQVANAHIYNSTTGINSATSGVTTANGVKFSTCTTNWSGSVNLMGSTLTGSTSATVTSGSTVYLGANGAQATELNGVWVVPRPGTVSLFYSASDASPSAGQTFTYTVRKNGSDTSMTATSSGAASTVATTTANSFAVVAGDYISIKLVTSGSATAARHRYTLTLDY